MLHDLSGVLNARGISAHFSVDRDGRLYEYVPIFNVADGPAGRREPLPVSVGALTRRERRRSAMPTSVSSAEAAREARARRHAWIGATPRPMFGGGARSP